MVRALDIGVYMPRPPNFKRPGAWRTKERDLLIEDSARVLCSLFGIGLHKRKPRNRVSKINILIGEKIEPHRFDSVLELPGNLDAAAYVGKSAEEQAEDILSLIVRTLTAAGKEIGISSADLTAATAFAREQRFVRKYRSTRCRSPMGASTTVEVEVTHSMRAAVVDAVFRSGHLEVSRKRIARTRPNEFVFGVFLGKLAWPTRETVSLRRTDGKTMKIRVPKPLLAPV